MAMPAPTLPLAAPAAIVADDPAASLAADETRARRPLRVLLLENDAEDAWVVSRFLSRSTRFDVRVTRCADAGEARAAVIAAPFDLWLFDIYLDRGTSLDFVAALRGVAREAHGAHAGEAPIVVLTGADAPAVEEMAFERGAMTCLAKADATTGTLDSAISAALRRSDAERDARERMAALDARLRHRTTLMGDLAHEIGNLANVSRTATALRGRSGDTDYDALVVEYVEQMHHTTRAILSHAGLAVAGEDVREHDPAELAARAGRLCQPLFAGTGRSLRLRGAAADGTAGGRAGTHGSVALDGVLLMQVVLNLVSNAVKHSPPGGDVELAVSLEADGLHVSVRDEGAGIPAARLAALRERGRRGATPAEGHGIGLAVVDSFLARMGGHLVIESGVGTGTTMRAIVPIALRTVA